MLTSAGPKHERSYKMRTLNIAFAQMDAIIGDFAGNYKKIIAYLNEAETKGADLLILPEGAVTGYPAMDLYNRPNFIAFADKFNKKIANATKSLNCGVLFGSIIHNHHERMPETFIDYEMPYNVAILAEKGEIKDIRIKMDLPNLDIFDEKRHFANDNLQGPIMFRGINIGVPICQDVWGEDVSECLTESGAEILCSINASTWNHGKYDHRLNMAAARISENKLPLIYLNASGGQDAFIFDGQSFALDKSGALLMQLPPFDEGLALSHWYDDPTHGWTCDDAPKSAPLEGDEMVYRCLMQGLKGYMDKNSFKKVILGLSGGIDSALTATIAVDALGAENVSAVMMPSQFTSKESLDDARALANNLSIKLDTINIDNIRDTFSHELTAFKEQGRPESIDIAEQNIQARIRANLLMFLSNLSGALLLTTGNKSECAMGYSTLYGDSCGGFSLLMDVYKTKVFALSKWRNKHYRPYMRGGDIKNGNIIPENIISRPPSAELCDNQRDDQSLPPYDKLDIMLEILIEGRGKISLAQKKLLKQHGISHDDLNNVWKKVMQNEHKRFQAAPGVKISSTAFGTGWRYPLSHHYHKDIATDS